MSMQFCRGWFWADDCVSAGYCGEGQDRASGGYIARRHFPELERNRIRELAAHPILSGFCALHV